MTTNIQFLKAAISTAEAVITKAQPLADKLAEMQAAVASIAEAQRVLGVLRGQLAEAETKERMRGEAQARNTVESIRLREGYTAGPASPHTVRITERFTSPYGPEVRTVPHRLDGLSVELLALVAADPEMVPTYILALDADPEQALRKHAQAVRRGYMIG